MPHPTYDAIIIGAGSVGLPLAWQLAEAGLHTLVLDQYASAGQGSNKHAIGGIRATHSDPSKIRICLKSIAIFSGWKETYGDDLGWLQGGYCFVAYRQREAAILKDLLEIQKRYGLDIDWLDRQALLERVPSLSPLHLLGGTFSPGDGSASPMLSALAFERRARARGACFRYNEAVTGLLRTGDRVIGVQTSQGDYPAGVVINVAGPQARQIAALAGVEAPVASDSHEAGITEPVAPFLKPMIVDIRPVEASPEMPGSASYYFYQHHTGQVLFCITPNPSILGTDIRETSAFLPQVSRRLVEIMPRLKNLKVRRTWRGLYPNTPDGAPIVGAVDGLQGYFLAVGMCGQGFMLGPGLAFFLRRLILGEMDEETRQVLDPLRLGRDFGVKEALK